MESTESATQKYHMLQLHTQKEQKKNIFEGVEKSNEIKSNIEALQGQGMDDTDDEDNDKDSEDDKDDDEHNDEYSDNDDDTVLVL